VLSGDDHRQVVSAAMSSLGGEGLVLLHEISPFTRHSTMLSLCWSGELRAAEQAAKLLLARSQRRGVTVDVADAHAILMNVEWLRGDVARTVGHADIVIASGEQLPSMYSAAKGFKALGLATQGRTSEALQELELPGDEREWSSLAGYHGYLLGAARTFLTVGDFRRAHRVALQLGTLATSMGTLNPAVLPWREAAAHAAAAMGMYPEARDLALDAVERARAFGAPGPLALALRALAAANEDDAETLLTEALTYAGQTADRLLMAQVHVALARALAGRGSHDEAQRHAKEGLELAQVIGARPLQTEAQAVAASRSPRPAASFGVSTSPSRGGHLRVLGGFSLVDGSGRVSTPRGLPGRAIRVLAASGGPLHVEQLADALWDEPLSPRQSRARLRNVIARARVADQPAIRRDGDVVYLDPDVAVDAVRFEEACARALAASDDDALEAAVAATLEYGGDLLPTDPYAEWAILARERLRLRYLAMCDRAARLAAEAGMNDLALDRLQAAIRHEPYDTDRYVQAAAILSASGDDAGAIAMREREHRIRSKLRP
jgi:DNA-binding SARP family transcriptional activator